MVFGSYQQGRTREGARAGTAMSLWHCYVTPIFVAPGHRPVLSPVPPGSHQCAGDRRALPGKAAGRQRRGHQGAVSLGVSVLGGDEGMCAQRAESEPGEEEVASPGCTAGKGSGLGWGGQNVWLSVDVGGPWLPVSALSAVWPPCTVPQFSHL